METLPSFLTRVNLAFASLAEDSFDKMPAGGFVPDAVFNRSASMTIRYVVFVFMMRIVCELKLIPLPWGLKRLFTDAKYNSVKNNYLLTKKGEAILDSQINTVFFLIN
jgi:hypothetical protein